MFSTENSQTGPLLAVYSYFRIVLSIILIGISFIDTSFQIKDSFEYSSFLLIASIYFFATIIQAIVHHYKRYTFSTPMVFFAILVDELFILALVYFGHTFSTEIAFLQTIPIAVAGMFFSGGLATIFAAFATLATLTNMAGFSLDNNFQQSQFIQAGLLGIVFFIVSLSMQAIARRIRATEQDAYESELHAREMAIISQHIVQRIRTGLIIFSTEGRITLTNDASEEYLGIKHIQHIRDTQLYNIYLKWQNDPTIHHQNIILGGELNDIQVSFSYLNYKEHVIAFIEGVAEISQHAQQIKLASLGRLSASIAHEIRNPLSAISHSLQLLKESPELHSTEDIHLLDISKKHITRINNTISNILEMSKNKQYNPTKIHLNDFIEELREDYLDKFANDIIFLIDKPDSEVHAPFDEVQLRQILSNIIDNALIFSFKKTGERWVRVEIAKEQTNPYKHAAINVFDKGPGIPSDDKERIFEPFFTTESTGTGLGLYIAKELCTLNQSQLDYIERDEKRYFQIRLSHPDRNILLKNF